LMEEFGIVQVFREDAGPENCRNPFPVPPLAPGTIPSDSVRSVDRVPPPRIGDVVLIIRVAEILESNAS
jgi:hypothetical protein